MSNPNPAAAPVAIATPEVMKKHSRDLYASIQRLSGESAGEYVLKAVLHAASQAVTFTPK